jgi:hypothetical protein
VVFFQGIGAGKEQIRRVLDVAVPLFDPKSLHVPEKDLAEVGYLPFIKRALPLYFWHVNIAGKNDVFAMAARCAEARKDRPVPNEIHFGISRGAATVFLNVILASQTNGMLPNFVVLEGCPDSIPGVLEARYGKWLAGIAEWFLCRFTSYDPQRARTHSPLALAHDFPKSVPVLLLTSENDITVPPENTKRLYDALIAAGHRRVTLVTFPKEDGLGHDDYYGVESQATTRYFNALHMHYAKYCKVKQ